MVERQREKERARARERGREGGREEERERGRKRERENSIWKLFIFKNSSIRSIWTYPSGNICGKYRSNWYERRTPTSNVFCTKGWNSIQTKKSTAVSCILCALIVYSMINSTLVP